MLVQIGLLDSELVLGKNGKQLPVVGREGAQKVLDEKSIPSNRLLSDW